MMSVIPASFADQDMDAPRRHEFIRIQDVGDSLSPEVTPQVTPQHRALTDSAETILPRREDEGVPIVVAGDTLFYIYPMLGVFSPQERARKTAEKIEFYIASPAHKDVPVSLTEDIGATAVVAGDLVLTVVTNEDARSVGGLRQEIAASRAQIIRHVVEQQRARRTPRTMVLGELFSALATIVLILAWRTITLLAHKLKDRLAGRHVLRFGPGSPLAAGTAADRRSDRVILAVKTIRMMLQLALLYAYITFVTGFFLVTEGLHLSLSRQLRGLAEWASSNFIGFLPDLFILAIVLTVMYVVMHIVRMVFVGLARGTVRWPGFRPEWAQPTAHILTLTLIMIAVILLWPHLPGSGSPIFAGVAIFLGILLLISSAVVGANWIAGVVLGYSIPFRVGDRVQIAGTTGDVVGWTMMATRLRTEKNVDVTIPNAIVLSNQIVNFSKPGPFRHLILSARVTVGSNVPWARAHELLIQAALRTSHVLKDPMPFVIQKQLRAEVVVYELNVQTVDPALLSHIQSNLYQNVFDVLREANMTVRAMTFGSQEDGTAERSMDQYLPKTQPPASFSVFPPLMRMFRKERSTPPESEHLPE